MLSNVNPMGTRGIVIKKKKFIRLDTKFKRDKLQINYLDFPILRTIVLHLENP